MDKKEYLASEVLKVCRNQLYFKMRFMEQALFYLVPEQKEEVFFGSDAKKLYYNTLYILNKYRECPDIVTCSLLHVVIHCLFQHPLQAGSHTRKYWDLAADIAAADVIKEFCITDLVQCIPAGCFTIINILKREIPLMSVNHIYHYLKDNELHIEKLCGMETGKMADLFRMDCHDLCGILQAARNITGMALKGFQKNGRKPQRMSFLPGRNLQYNMAAYGETCRAVLHRTLKNLYVITMIILLSCVNLLLWKSK